MLCMVNFTTGNIYNLGAVHMSRASPANGADSILSRPVVA